MAAGGQIQQLYILENMVIPAAIKQPSPFPIRHQAQNTDLQSIFSKMFQQPTIPSS
jgi:hypothetical protein